MELVVFPLPANERCFFSSASEECGMKGARERERERERAPTDEEMSLSVIRRGEETLVVIYSLLYCLMERYT